MQHAQRAVYLHSAFVQIGGKRSQDLDLNWTPHPPLLNFLDARRSGTPFICLIPLLFAAIISKMQIRVPKNLKPPTFLMDLVD